MQRINIAILLFFEIISLNAYSQNLLDKITYTTEAGAIVSSSNATPFLLRSNQYGLVPFQSQIAYLNGSAKKEYDSTYSFSKMLKPYGFGYGAELHTNVGMSNQVFLPQMYIKFRFKAAEFYGGRRKEIQGLVDTTGTIGSYIWSGNALPIPKIQISLPNYTSITKNGLISIKGNFAHGWFGSTDSVKHYFLHQKSLYVRFGKPDWRFKFYGGINHQVQWGGKPAVPFYDPISNQIISKYGNDFKTYLDVISGLSMARGGNNISNQPGVAANEAGNRTGNHLGTLDIGLEYQNEGYRILIYRQSIYETGALYYLNNIADGLLGISYKNLNKEGIIKNLCVEYLNTTSQGGGVFVDNVPQLRGINNYFNNGIYLDGWTYRGNTIGNSMLVPYNILVNSNKELVGEKLGENTIINNRTKMFNIKANYSIANVSLMTQMVYSNNLGNYFINFNKSQFSFLQKANIKFKIYAVYCKAAIDIGQLYKPSIGFNCGIVRNW